MTAITIIDLENAAQDVATIGSIANSASPTVTDRLGQSRPTMTGLAAEYPAASANAAAALVSKTAAGVSETNALASKVAAESARDSINTTSKVFTSAEGTSAGIAATTNGQQFSVLSADLLSYGIWRNNSGAALWLSGGYTKAYFDSFSRLADPSQYGYSWGVQGSDGRIPLGLDLAGDLLHLGASVRGLITAADMTANFSAVDVARYGYIFALTGTDGRIPVAFTDDGRLLINGVDSISALTSRTTVLESKTATLTAIYCFGDSMTQGNGGTSYPTQLAALMPSRTVSNNGVGGQTSDGIFSRWGSYPILVTLPGNVVPASGSVDFNQSAPNAIPIIHTGGGPINGWVGGVYGTLSYVAQVTAYVTYTLRFTRAVAGSAVAILPNEPFIPDTAATEYCTPIFWAARNSLGLQNPTVSAADQIANVMQWHADAIDFYKPLDKHFLILGPSNRNDEYAGSTTTVGGMTGDTAYSTILTVNALLKAKYPKNYIDVRKLVVNSYVTDAGGVEDIAFGRDVPPPSKLSDHIHYNTAGYAIVANAVSVRLTNLGW